MGESRDSAKRSVAIFGSTGSIGRSALDVIRRHPERFKVTALAARSSAGVLLEQIAEFQPQAVAVMEARAAGLVRAETHGVEVLEGTAGLEELASRRADVALCAVVGAVGLAPLMRAIEAGSRIALANKEPLVMAGPLVTAHAERHGVHLTPVDSEHSAIFQCLQGHPPEHVRCIHLTASGGPFYGRTRESLAGVGPGEAARHPTWDMGAKISVDSSTLMNKGLEVIEAMWLFRVPVNRIEVVIHPQSIIHSLVEFTDGALLAHLGVTDMRFPIEFALAWPDRAPSAMERLDLTTLRDLTFGAPDFSEFPCLGLALEAARRGGTAPATLNAANEAAVAAFCEGRAGFLDIADAVEHALERAAWTADPAIEDVLEADAEARRRAEAWLAQRGG